MNITAGSLNAKTQELVKQDIAIIVGVEPAEISLFSVSYEMESESLNLKDVTRKDAHTCNCSIWRENIPCSQSFRRN